MRRMNIARHLARSLAALGTLLSVSLVLPTATHAASPAPIAGNDLYEVKFNTPFTSNVMVNDLNGYRVALVAGAGPQHGTLSLDAQGNFTYQPAPDYAGPDTFAYALYSVDGQKSVYPGEVEIAVARQVISAELDLKIKLDAITSAMQLALEDKLEKTHASKRRVNEKTDTIKDHQAAINSLAQKLAASSDPTQQQQVKTKIDQLRATIEQLVSELQGAISTHKNDYDDVENAVKVSTKSPQQHLPALK